MLQCDWIEVFVKYCFLGLRKYIDPADEQMSVEIKLQIVQHYANKLRDDSKIEHKHSWCCLN